MRIEQQVASVSQCKKLKELGVKQSGLFSWLYNNYSGEYEISKQNVEALQLLAKSNTDSWKERIDKGIFSAWTASELAEILPYRLRDELKSENPHLRIYRGGNQWSVKYHNTFSRPYVQTGDVESLVEGLANTLIHIIEHKLISVEEINSKL